MNRSAGIFLHPTSLPSPFGIGDLGGTAFEWISMLKKCEQNYWQVCPLGPTGYGDSPYQCLSSFAGNTFLISPVKLMEEGLLTRADIDSYPELSEDHIDYQAVDKEKEILFRKAFERFNDTDDFTSFCDLEKYWLDDYSLYKVIKNSISQKAWNEWDVPLKLRYPAALSTVKQFEYKEIRFHKFLQFMFHRQWRQLKAFAKSQGIKIIGDVPVYVALDSADA